MSNAVKIILERDHNGTFQHNGRGGAGPPIENALDALDLYDLALAMWPAEGEPGGMAYLPITGMDRLAEAQNSDEPPTLTAILIPCTDQKSAHALKQILRPQTTN